MKRFVVVSGLALSAFFAATPGYVHHSFAAIFDADQPIILTGTVTELEWMNPHTWFYLDVENEEGEVENWGFELGSPNSLLRRGWTRDALQVGDIVSVVGSRARDGSRTVAVRSVTLTTGESLFGAQDTSR